MTKSKIFLYLCLSFIGGIFLNSFFPLSKTHLLKLLVLGAILTSFFLIFKKRRLTVIVLCFLFFSFGAWRHQSFNLRIKNNELKDYIRDEATVSLIGIINKEPSIGGKSTKIEFQPEGIEGKILLFIWKYPQYKYGDKLKVKGQ